MSAWRISSWSRELGRGTVSCPAFGTVPFDGHHADADDFDIGEEVLVESVRHADQFVVRSVHPVRPHLPKEEPRRSAPPLDELVLADAKVAVAEADRWLDFRVSRLDSTVVEIELDDDDFSYPPFARLIVEAPYYIELPPGLDADMISLSKETERAYLHSRVGLDERAIALTLIRDDSPPKFFFIVGRRVRFEPRAVSPQ